LNWIDGLTVHNVTLANSPLWGIAVWSSNQVKLTHLRVLALRWQGKVVAVQTDAVGLLGCSDVHVADSFFESSDDCVSPKQTCSNILIERVICGHEADNPNNGAITFDIGAVTNLTFRDSTVYDVRDLLRVENYMGTGGGASEITVENIRFANISHFLTMETESWATTHQQPDHAATLRQLDPAQHQWLVGASWESGWPDVPGGDAV
jgi:polygalacturonase